MGHGVYVSLECRPEDVAAFSEAFGDEPETDGEWGGIHTADAYDVLSEAHHIDSPIHGLPFVASVTAEDFYIPWRAAHAGGPEDDSKIIDTSVLDGSPIYHLRGDKTTADRLEDIAAWLGLVERFHAAELAAQDIIGDAVEALDKAERRAAANERGSIRLTLLAFQAAVAIGLGSGVWSILEWAQAALGGVL